MKLNIIAGAVAVAAAVTAGCSKTGEDKSPAANGETRTEAAKEVKKINPEEVSVKIGKSVLKRGEIEADVEKIVASQKGSFPEDQVEGFKQYLAAQLVQQFIVEKALSEKAEKLGYTVTDEDVASREKKLLEELSGRPDAPKTVEELREKIFASSPFGKKRAEEEFRTATLIDKMIAAEVVEKITNDFSKAAEEEIAKVIEANAKVEPEKAKALEKIKGLKAKLDAVPEAERAAKFAELAKENSDCPSGQRGGDLDFFERGRMVPEFSDAAFSLAEGKISDPVLSPFGYHLIMVTGKKAAEKAKDGKETAPEMVKASHILVKCPSAQQVPDAKTVAERLKRDASRRAVGEFVRDAVKTAEIVTSAEFSSLLPKDEPKKEAKETKVDSAPEK